VSDPAGESDPVRAVAFDLGGVLLDWDPRHLYRRMMGSAEEMERFLGTVCTPEWNLRLDAGLPFERAIDELVACHPAREEFIRAYRSRWPEMVAGPVPGMPELLHDVQKAGLPSYILTNSSAETYPLMVDRYPFLDTVHGAVVSGEVGVVKPDPEIFQVLLARFGLDPATTLFVDDAPANVAGARACGLRAVRFTGAHDLRDALREAGVGVRAPAGRSGSPVSGFR
jgi:2-haloacid dehalogenase